ncbi:MAG: O-antigen ligase [Coleofasciculus sp. A1-SPW-01]|uniref:O-antigen ligase family protein n=1 Tax=Coleofasciculus sp. A1-SPW-01 TaxID=3070819 RepID=UPI0032FC099F
MKQLFLNPLIITLVVFTALVYIVIGFQLINARLKRAEKFEMICIVLLLLSNSVIWPNIFGKFKPEVLYLPGKTIPSLVVQIFLYVICCLFLYSRLKNKLNNFIFVIGSVIKFNPFFAGYIMILLLSFIWSEDPTYTLKASIVCLIVTALFIYIGKEYSMVELLNILLSYHTIVLILSLIYTSGHGINWSGVIGHKNPFSFVMNLSVILLYLQSIRLPKYKGLFLGLAALSVFCVQQAGSGMGKVLLVVLISLLIFARFLKHLPAKLAFACMGLFLAIGVSLAILIVENAELIIVQKLGKDMTLTGRTYIWPVVIDAINKSPWLGYGYQGFWQPWRGLKNPGAVIKAKELVFIPMHSHNGYLDMGLDLGWVGLGLFIISLIINIYYGVNYFIKNNTPESLLPLVFFTWLSISNVTENGINQISNGWLIYVLMTARLTMEMADAQLKSGRFLQNSRHLDSLSLVNPVHPKTDQ